MITTVVGLFLTLGAVSTLHAQSEIYSLPSAAVTDKNSAYCETDANPAITPSGTGTYMQRCMGGVAKGFELGVNGLAAFSNPPTPGEIQPTVKYQWLNHGNLQFASGVTGFIPVTHTSDETAFAELYTVGRYQTKLKDLGGYSPAFSAGAWALVGRQSGTGSREGVILGIEQPLVLDKTGAPKVSFVTDWQSGNQTHAGFSSANSGVVVNLPHNLVAAFGYSFSNLGRKYDTPAFWLGYTFKFRKK